MASRVHPVWLVLIGIASVQLGAGVAKSLFDEVSPTTLVWVRLASSALILGAVARPRLGGRTRDDWVVAIGFGIALAVMNWAFYQSIARIPLGLAVTFEFVGPLTLAVLGSRRITDLLWVLLAAAGVALLGVRGGDLDLLGVVFALVAGAAWASYILLSVQTGRRWEGLSGLVAASIVATLVLTPLTFAAHAGELLDLRVLAIGTAVGLLSSVVPYASELVALRSIAPSLLSILLSLEPAAAALTGIVLLGEHLTLLQWTAIGCVVVASVGATRSGRTVAEVAPA